MGDMGQLHDSRDRPTTPDSIEGRGLQVSHYTGTCASSPEFPHTMADPIDSALYVHLPRQFPPR